MFHKRSPEINPAHEEAFERMAEAKRKIEKLLHQEVEVSGMPGPESYVVNTAKLVESPEFRGVVIQAQSYDAAVNDFADAGPHYNLHILGLTGDRTFEYKSFEVAPRQEVNPVVAAPVLAAIALQLESAS